VRVRGQIPTDVQVLVISGATIYIEGSITKGVIGNHVTAQDPVAPVAEGQLLTRDTRSALGLFAKDYVTLNTTQFFGVGGNQTVELAHNSPALASYSPVLLRNPGSGLGFLAEMLLDPDSGTAFNSSTWSPYAKEYVDPLTTTLISQDLLVEHSMDAGPGSATFFGLNVNPGLPTPTYLFGTVATPTTNSAAPFYTPIPYTTPGYGPVTIGHVPLYGLGGQPWQVYPKFEGIQFPLFDNASAYAFPSLGASPAFGLYQALPEHTNEFSIRPDSVGGSSVNDYLLARIALVPNDIRIEASIYAQEGSFFVIPGPWFNPNPNDTRENYITLGANRAQRDLARFEDFGNGPEIPFYGEPLDVRIKIIGSVSENMPQPISVQAEWLKKWGWIPRFSGASGVMIPGAPPTLDGHYIPSIHANGADLTTVQYVPNLTISYDPMLGTGRTNAASNGIVVRKDALGRTLPPIPRLPVSPSFAYFGEVNP
jgi:hypothetical protein